MRQAHAGERPDERVALRFSAVDLDRPGPPPVRILRRLDWLVRSGEKWVVLGPNGSGKTTMFELASGYLHPTRGTVEVLGDRLGAVDVRRLRRRIGLVSGAVAKKLYPHVSALDIVMSAANGALEPWWDAYPPEERDRARWLLDRAGAGYAAERPFGVLSDGERQRVLLARAMMPSPGLMLLDEPAAGLDLGGREQIVAVLASLAADPSSPPTVLITHHVEEIPPDFTHCVLLGRTGVVANGELEDALTAGALSEAFGLPLHLEKRDGRYSCRAVLR